MEVKKAVSGGGPVHPRYNLARTGTPPRSRYALRRAARGRGALMKHGRAMTKTLKNVINFCCLSVRGSVFKCHPSFPPAARSRNAVMVAKCPDFYQRNLVPIGTGPGQAGNSSLQLGKVLLFSHKKLAFECL